MTEWGYCFGAMFLSKIDYTEELRNTMKLLNLGCGHKYHSDWINVNFYKSGEAVIVHDLNQPLPWPDQYFDMVYHSHVLEHFPKNQGRIFLSECRRVLKPQGILRVVIPDLEGIVREYIRNLDLARTGDATAKHRYDWILYELLDQVQRNQSGGGMLNYWKKRPLPAREYIIERLGMEVKGFLDFFESQPDGAKPFSRKQTLKEKIQNRLLSWMGYTREMAEIGKFRLSGEVHYWMYDEYSLSELLKDVGFSKVIQMNAFTSNHPGFSSYHLDGEPDGSIRKPDSIFVEALP